MIKKILTIGILTLGLFNFINATDLSLIKIGNIGEYLQTTQSSPEFTVQEKGNLNSIQLGNSKNFLALSDSDFTNVKNKKYFWWNNGKAYFYWSLTGSSYTPNLIAGEFIKYYYCNNVLTGNHVYNCSLYDYSDNIKSFFSSISSSDKFGYYVKSINQNSIDLRICFSSNSIGKSVCFDNTNTGFYDLIDMTENLSFDDFPSSLLGNSPGVQNGGNIDGGSQNVNNSSITGNVTYSICTKQKALNYYRVQGYKDKLCYSSYGNDIDIYTGPSSVSDYSLTGTDIIDVWFDTWHLRRYGNTGSDLSYSDWFQYWRKSFEVYNNSYNSSGIISNPFVGVPVSLFTLFGNVYSYGLAFNNESILDYCSLVLLDQDLNTAYTGLLGTIPCNYSAIDILADTLGLHAESGEVVEGSSWDGILNRSGYHLDLGRNSGSVSSGSKTGLSYFGDGKTFINNSFNILSNSYRFPDRNSNGIIPNYILVFMFALILFRFISH